jgi:hypothetical protein
MALEIYQDLKIGIVAINVVAYALKIRIIITVITPLA